MYNIFIYFLWFEQHLWHGKSHELSMFMVEALLFGITFLLVMYRIRINYYGMHLIRMMDDQNANIKRWLFFDLLILSIQFCIIVYYVFFCWFEIYVLYLSISYFALNM